MKQGFFSEDSLETTLTFKNELNNKSNNFRMKHGKHEKPCKLYLGSISYKL
jgi:hypothetical protein